MLPSHIPMPVSNFSLERLSQPPPVGSTSLSRCSPKTFPSGRLRVWTPLDAPLYQEDSPPGISSLPLGGVFTSSAKRHFSRASLMKHTHTSAHALKMSTPSLSCSEEMKRLLDHSPNAPKPPKLLPPPLERENSTTLDGAASKILFHSLNAWATYESGVPYKLFFNYIMLKLPLILKFYKTIS